MSDIPDEVEHQGALKGGRPAGLGRPLGGVLLLPALAFSSTLMLTLLLCDHVLHRVAPPKCSRPLLCLHD
jgi:hypothetical protein